MPWATLMQVTLHGSYLPINSSCGSDALFPLGVWLLLEIYHQPILAQILSSQRKSLTVKSHFQDLHSKSHVGDAKLRDCGHSAQSFMTK